MDCKSRWPRVSQKVDRLHGSTNGCCRCAVRRLRRNLAADAGMRSTRRANGSGKRNQRLNAARSSTAVIFATNKAASCCNASGAASRAEAETKRMYAIGGGAPLIQNLRARHRSWRRCDGSCQPDGRPARQSGGAAALRYPRRLVGGCGFPNDEVGQKFE